MTSKLQVDNIEGRTTKGSITVTGESNGASTNLQQGLAKALCVYNGQGTAAITDSFNIASLTDNASGKHTSTLTNSMVETTTPISTSYATNGSNNYNIATESVTASTVQLRTVQWGVDFYDDPRCSFSRFGDLA
tara:strand:- start:890 stop:1291 length:402 start_codon:yes stop_codon:yes gene_type:complete